MNKDDKADDFNVKLEYNEFVVSLDGEPAKIFKDGGSLGIMLRNPHAPLNYDVASLSMLKVLMKKINESKPSKPIPSDDAISEIIRKVKKEYIAKNDGMREFNVDLFKEVWRISQS